jgi:hypothetical protein
MATEWSEGSAGYQHDLIAERLATFNSIPTRRGGVDEVRRRDAGMVLHTTIVGHLRGHHGWKGNSSDWSPADLIEIHNEAHGIPFMGTDPLVDGMVAQKYAPEPDPLGPEGAE